MKTTKKMLTILLAVAMILSMATVAFAQEVTVDATKNGSITIDNAAEGENYSIYKLFDATVSNTTVNGEKAVSYTTDKTSLVAGGVDGSQWFELKNGNVTKKAGVADDFVTSANFKTWAKAFGTQVGTTTEATSNPLTFKGIPYGYYFVESTLGATISVNSTTPAVTLQDKNYPDNPPFKKVIKGANQQELKYDDAMVGEQVTWDLSINTFNFIQGKKVLTWYAYDIMPPGMTLVDGSLTVKETLGNTTIAAKPAVNGYTIKYFKDKEMTQPTTVVTEARAFTVEVPWTVGQTLAGNPLYQNATVLHFEYKAFIDPAKIGDVDFTKPLENDFYPAWDDDEDPNTPPVKILPDPTTPDQGKTKIPAATLDIFKYYMDGQAQKSLQGAKFTLEGPTGLVSYVFTEEFTPDANGEYWKLKDGRYTKDDPNAQGMDQSLYDSITQKYKAEKKGSLISETTTGQTTTPVTQITAGDGTLKFEGLIAGTYTLTETEAPSGFNKIDPITFTLKMEAKQDGTFDKWVLENAPQGVTLAGNVVSMNIEDKAGTTLPSTGGLGTTIFYVLGAVLVVAAGIFMIVNRRMKKIDNK